MTLKIDLDFPIIRTAGLQAHAAVLICGQLIFLAIVFLLCDAVRLFLGKMEYTVIHSKRIV